MNQKNPSFSIKDWKDDDKPREKIILKGKEVVSDAELIAILIGSGSRSESAVKLSKRILARVDNNLNKGKLVTILMDDASHNKQTTLKSNAIISYISSEAIVEVGVSSVIKCGGKYFKFIRLFALTPFARN